MSARPLDPRGILWFLVVTFGLTWAADAVIITLSDTMPAAYGIGVAATMFIPALAAVAVRRFAPSPDDPGLGLTFGPLKYYLHVWWIVPSLFAGTYAVTWLSGAGAFDPSLTYLFRVIEGMGATVTPEEAKVLTNPIYLPIILLSSLTYAPFVNSLAAFGEELGWRGFLWPRLRPIGFWPATLTLGVIWGLWHGPLIAFMGFNYPDHRYAGVLWMIVLTTLLGTWMNWLKDRTGSTYLAAWVHGVFNSQAYGVWRALTWPVNNLVGGLAGVIGLAFLALPTVWLVATGRLDKTGVTDTSR